MCLPSPTRRAATARKQRTAALPVPAFLRSISAVSRGAGMEIAAAWVVIVHALAATMFAALAGLLAVSNRLHGRAAVLALGSLGMTAWNAAIVWTCFDAAAPRAIPQLEALQVICWLTLISPLAALIGSQPLRPVLSALAVAAVGVATVDVLRAHAAPLYVDASVAASFAILWILIEVWRAPI